MKFLLQHCQTSHRGVKVLKCFPEIKSICSHIAQYYVNLCDVISGHKSTQSAALLQSRERGQNEEAGRHGAEQGELSPRLTTFFCPYAHPFSISLATPTTYLLGKSCETKESHESFSSYESFNFSPQISLKWHWQSTSVPHGHSGPTVNEILSCGVWDQWFSHILWAVQISPFATFVFPSSLLEEWFLQFFSLLFFRKKKSSHDREKKSVKHQTTPKENIVCQMLTQVSCGYFLNPACSCFHI